MMKENIQMNSKGRGIDDYYIMDVMENVTGEPLSGEIKERYSLTRGSTYVELCNNCEIIFSLQPT